MNGGFKLQKEDIANHWMIIHPYLKSKEKFRNCRLNITIKIKFNQIQANSDCKCPVLAKLLALFTASFDATASKELRHNCT